MSESSQGLAQAALTSATAPSAEQGPITRLPPELLPEIARHLSAVDEDSFARVGKKYWNNLADEPAKKTKRDEISDSILPEIFKKIEERGHPSALAMAPLARTIDCMGKERQGKLLDFIEAVPTAELTNGHFLEVGRNLKSLDPELYPRIQELVSRFAQPAAGETADQRMEREFAGAACFGGIGVGLTKDLQEKQADLRGTLRGLYDGLQTRSASSYAGTGLLSVADAWPPGEYSELCEKYIDTADPDIQFADGLPPINQTRMNVAGVMGPNLARLSDGARARVLDLTKRFADPAKAEIT